MFQIYYDAYQLIWTVVLVLGILLRIRSSFIALSWVFFVSIGNVLKSYLFGKWRGTYRFTHNSFSYLYQNLVVMTEIRGLECTDSWLSKFLFEEISHHYKLVKYLVVGIFVHQRVFQIRRSGCCSILEWWACRSSRVST